MDEHRMTVEPAELPPLNTERHRTVILDTNAWLDWLVFADPATTLLNQLFENGDLILPASPSGRDEFIDVIGRDQFRLDHTQQLERIARYDRICQLMPSAREAGRDTHLRCSDPDDQQFLELAIGANAGWLLTRDRALLKLARRALRDHQFQITSLSQWSSQRASQLTSLSTNPSK